VVSVYEVDPYPRTAEQILRAAARNRYPKSSE
jgi:hypothetical protein